MKKLVWIFFVVANHYGFAQNRERELLLKNKVSEIRVYESDNTNNKHLKHTIFINDSGLSIKEIIDTFMITNNEYDSFNQTTKSITTYKEKTYSTTYVYQENGKVITTDEQGKSSEGYCKIKKRINKTILFEYINGKKVYKTISKKRKNKSVTYKYNKNPTLRSTVIAYRNSNNLVIKKIVILKSKCCKNEKMIIENSYNDRGLLEKSCTTYPKCKCYDTNKNYCNYYEYITTK